MKKISLTLAGLLTFGAAAVFAQVDSVNTQRSTQDQYRKQQTDPQTTTPTTPTKPRKDGPEAAEDELNNSQLDNNQSLPQGTVSGSKPYDTINSTRPTGGQSTIGTNRTGTTSGTTGSGSYGTGVNGTGSGTKGTSSSYGTKTNSATAQDSTFRQKQE